ncbi:MAG TPA: ComF family protein [Candidatus Hydrogenedentes bacterium]|nr:ComF family protein [Candidatus Hydrogenedentota bacterium]HOV72580.1 ComF family protein [Candidatus Hydrogenedentota bacterium]HPC15258.1 ComF family protein [Candidatus Hydrogenedentota bacterium]HRT19213.1 ComF family protein [Candidatus Hydrogenedentota bacterium]HRT63293.1 ComF family protein [Candidatus Hydrogenedentota bacterium]
MRPLNDWLLAVKNILTPIFCHQCGIRLLTEENLFFCPTCWEMSPRIEPPFCCICGKPHPTAAGFGLRGNFPCATCRSEPVPPYRRIYGAARYAEAVEKAIKLLKFHGRRNVAQYLGALMRDFAVRHMDVGRYDCIVPVPLYRVRERERGYNQTRLLAQEIAPVFPNARHDESLQRIRPTIPQSRLRSPEERRRNVAGAFAFRDRSTEGKSVLLIDDVVTTRDTVTECARVIREAGAENVDVFAAALALQRAADS